jgi:hypothetical protein
VVKYTWKFRKAARQAGMNFWVRRCTSRVIHFRAYTACL